MNIDFTSGRITLVVAPVDMRSGYKRLASIARALLDIDVDAGGEFVAFISKTRGVCKVIWSDSRGSAVLTRKLNVGKFEQFLARANGPATKEFTPEDLNLFLDGEPIFVKRNEILV